MLTRILLGEDNKVTSPVLGPGLFRMSWIQRHLLTIANGGEAIAFHPKFYQIELSAHGPPLSQGQIIFITSSLVTVALDLYGKVGMGL